MAADLTEEEQLEALKSWWKTSVRSVRTDDSVEQALRLVGTLRADSPFSGTTDDSDADCAKNDEKGK